ncbi:MAG: ATP-binding protein [Acidobacteria bacterium]|nr:ATP-binding protein [Planctomycetota bacterium]MBE3135755.1 ATP-binding protein [Acidobacteriota bacterium]
MASASGSRCGTSRAGPRPQPYGRHKARAELLFEVVSRAYERTSLAVTTNLPFEAWTEVCGSERLTGAILDRLTHRVHILEANGESYRLRESRRRLKARKA